jgi:hypothetical protein
MAKKKTSATETVASPAAAAPTGRKRMAVAAAPKAGNGNARQAGNGNARPAPTGGPTHDEIAMAAYHRYLSRQGAQGSDFDDWLEAERDLRSRSASRPRSQGPNPNS